MTRAAGPQTLPSFSARYVLQDVPYFSYNEKQKICSEILVTV